VNIEQKYQEYIKNVDLNNLNFITAEEYQKLHHDEQFYLTMKWAVEEEDIKRQLVTNGKSRNDIDNKDTSLFKLIIVNRPLYKDSILLTYPDNIKEIYDDAKEISEKLNITFQKVNNYAFYKRQLNGIKFEKVRQKLFGNEYKIISHNDKN
jgi:hypothetical protein